MWLFELYYFGDDYQGDRKDTIAIDGNAFDSVEQIYISAIVTAFARKKYNEFLRTVNCIGLE